MIFFTYDNRREGGTNCSWNSPARISANTACTMSSASSLRGPSSISACRTRTVQCPRARRSTHLLSSEGVGPPPEKEGVSARNPDRCTSCSTPLMADTPAKRTSASRREGGREIAKTVKHDGTPSKERDPDSQLPKSQGDHIIRGRYRPSPSCAWAVSAYFSMITTRPASSPARTASPVAVSGPTEITGDRTGRICPHGRCRAPGRSGSGPHTGQPTVIFNRQNPPKKALRQTETNPGPEVVGPAGREETVGCFATS